MAPRTQRSMAHLHTTRMMSLPKGAQRSGGKVRNEFIRVARQVTSESVQISIVVPPSEWYEYNTQSTAGLIVSWPREIFSAEKH